MTSNGALVRSELASSLRPVKRHPIVELIALLALSAVVAGVSARVTVHTVATWYPTLHKPPFDPPNWLFGPVWTLLYVTMAIAAWRIWRQPDRNGKWVFEWLYAAQIALNFAWSQIFFCMHQIGAALVDIAVLWATLGSQRWCSGGAMRWPVFDGLLPCVGFIRRGAELCHLALKLRRASE